jgi:hypothetical protein
LETSDARAEAGKLSAMLPDEAGVW